MDEYFGNDDFTDQTYNPPQPTQERQDAFDFDATPAQPTYAAESQTFVFGYDTPTPTPNAQGQAANQENDFNEFQEDETTKRIREEEERIQNTLREKSEREWQDKAARKAEGKRQLEEYQARKEQEKTERAAENIRKEAIAREELAKLNVEAGWRKVITNINVRAGEHKGKKDIARMRESILHRREDDKR